MCWCVGVVLLVWWQARDAPRHQRRRVRAAEYCQMRPASLLAYHAGPVTAFARLLEPLVSVGNRLVYF